MNSNATPDTMSVYVSLLGALLDPVGGSLGRPPPRGGGRDEEEEDEDQEVEVEEDEKEGVGPRGEF